MFFFDQSRPNKYSYLKKLITPFLLKDCYYKNNLCRERFGSGDGSYVLSPEFVFDTSYVYSYGIGSDPEGVSFEKEISGRVKKVFMYDGSISNAPLKLKNGVFYSEFLDQDNFSNHISKKGGRFYEEDILKIDIEGHEYEWLSEKNMKILSKNFAQVAIEVHSLIEEIPEGWVVEPQMLKAKKDNKIKKEFFEKMNSGFYLFHIHANNHAPRHLDFPDSLELTYINKKLVDCEGVYPMTFPIEGVDKPNYNGREDYVLDWWL